MRISTRVTLLFFASPLLLASGLFLGTSEQARVDANSTTGVDSLKPSRLASLQAVGQAPARLAALQKDLAGPHSTDESGPLLIPPGTKSRRLHSPPGAGQSWAEPTLAEALRPRRSDAWGPGRGGKASSLLAGRPKRWLEAREWPGALLAAVWEGAGSGRAKHPHGDEELPLSAKMVYGTLVGFYAYATAISLRRGLAFRDDVAQLQHPCDLSVHGFCGAAVAVLALTNLLVLLEVRCILFLPWLYCGRLVAVMCWVMGFGHANGADRLETVQASALAGLAVGLLGAGAVLAGCINDSGVEQSVWPWVLFVAGCICGAAAKQTLSGISRSSMTWYELKVQERIVTVSECVGYLCICYAALWVMTEGVPMLNEAGEATFFGLVDALLVASNGAILMRAVEQNVISPFPAPKPAPAPSFGDEAEKAAAGGAPQVAGPETFFIGEVGQAAAPQ